MAPPPSSWLVHVKTFIDPDLPAVHQTASCDALFELIAQKALSLSQIVSEMGEYLTTSDGVIRARGTLLLAELLMKLCGQPLENTVIQNFAIFFSARLEDWHSLHGTLVGCLALLRRKEDEGSVNDEDAKLLVESTLKNLEVQALTQPDRMLCLELFECLLLHHQAAVEYHATLFVDGICEAIDGEKDPRCLLVAFRIMELAVKLFPDPEGPIGKVLEDVFGNISCYFPISFNPAPDDQRGITREDLSMALMKCFAATKLFADFCIPFLLEKLSSSLTSAKRDSLKFLGFCVSHYGSEGLQTHATAIWTGLKHELLSSSNTEEMGPRGKRDEVLSEALDCVTACVRAFQACSTPDVDPMDANTFLQLMLEDAFLDDFISCLPLCLVHTDEETAGSMLLDDHAVSRETSVALQRARAAIKETGLVLATAVKSSTHSCFAVLHILLNRMFGVMKFEDHLDKGALLDFVHGVRVNSSLYFPESLMVPLMEVITFLVEGAREVAERFCMLHLRSEVPVTDVKWVTPLQFYSDKLVMSFPLMIAFGLQHTTTGKFPSIEKIWQIGVAGLQAVASFPSQVGAFSELDYEFTRSVLKGIILKRSKIESLWNQAVGAVEEICRTEETFPVGCGLLDSLLPALLGELLEGRNNLPVDRNLKALAAISNGRRDILDRAVRMLRELICDNLKALIPTSDATDAAYERLVSLLQAFLQYIIPCCETTALENRAMWEMATDMLGAIESLPESLNLKLVSSMPASYVTHNIQMLEGSMGILQFAVSNCDEDSQRVLLSNTLDRFLVASSIIVDDCSVKQLWSFGLFASAAAALRSSVRVPKEIEVLQRLLKIAVSPACSGLVCEAVGAMLNKWQESNDKSGDTTCFSLTVAIGLVLEGKWISNGLSRACHTDGSCNSDVRKDVKIRCIKVMACIGKGLAMRAHIAVSEVAMMLLRLAGGNKPLIDADNDALLTILWPDAEERMAISFAAADALGFILKESITSSRKQNHMIIKPLYKQRLFVCMLAPLTLALKEADARGRAMLYYAFGSIVSGVPINVILMETVKVFPLLLESLSVLRVEQMHSGVLLSVLLVLSALLVDKNGITVNWLNWCPTWLSDYASFTLPDNWCPTWLSDYASFTGGCLMCGSYAGSFDS